MLRQTRSEDKVNRGPLYVSGVSLLLLMLSVWLNVALGYKLRAANQKILKTNQESRVAPGDLLPDLHAQKLDGSKFSYAYLGAQRPTLVYVFSPTCGWYEKNLENIKELYSKLGSDYSFIALSMSEQGLDRFVRSHDWKFPIVKEPSPATVLSYRLGGTPQTILVSQDGHVIKNWQGAYMGTVKKEVEEHFGLSLPGISETSLMSSTSDPTNPVQ